MSFLSFPPNFLWGTATAAHQVEGQNYNSDWWEWEQTPGHVRNGDSSRVACDWWNGRYLEDFDRARELGQNAHRLSVEWSRIEPREGEFDPSAIGFYRHMLEALHARGMTPMVTLQHFTLPQWVACRGGWLDPVLPQFLARYTDFVVSQLGELCNLWVTLNEPNGNAYLGYSEGSFPPGEKNFAKTLRVMAQMVRGHAAMYHALKHAQPDSKVGIAYHFRRFAPFQSDSRLDRLGVSLLDRIFNRAILVAIEEGRFRFPLGTGQTVPEARGAQDFIGLNYYYAERDAFDARRPTELFRRAVFRSETRELQKVFGAAGDVEPRGIEILARELAQYGKPIYITENGIPEVDEANQSGYLISHLAALHRALQVGVDVRGYFWWTLVDNFEWTEGYTPRFGLYRNDLQTQERTPKPIAAIYARIARENGIADEVLETYGRAD